MKTFIPRGSLTRKDRLNKSPSKIYPFAACAFAIQDDLNLNLIYRSLCNFAGREFFIIGAKSWHRGATNGLEEMVKITYFDNFNQFLEHTNKTNYELVAIEQSERSVYLNEFKHPKMPCFILGNESIGLTDEVLLNSKSIVEIPMDGFHPCLNVGVSSGIVFYDFVRKLNG
jgi:tRNA G18 (ribose-2'-O)-methylase SpoU